MGFARKLKSAFAPPPAGNAVAAYDAAVRLARDPAWYLEAGVPDSVDGRFDVLAFVLSLLVIRAQAEGDRAFEAALVDRFADDMDASLREMGVGDLSIGKAVGQATGALGGRVSAYRLALGGGDAELDEALRRNLFRGAETDATAARTLTRGAAARLAALSWAETVEGRW